MVLLVRDVRGPWPDHVQRDTHPTGCSRLGTAEVESRKPSWTGAVKARASASLGTSKQNLVSSAGFRAPVYEAGGRTFESCTRYQHRGVWQRGRLQLPVKQSPTRTRWFESIRTHQPTPG